MEKQIKYQIIKMLIPLIGIWWVIKRIVPNLDEITWWDTSRKSGLILVSLFTYQVFCFLSYKVFYMMYFFNYTFEQIFTQW